MMRRLAFVLAAVSLLVFGLGLAGNAASSRPSTTASGDLSDKTTGMNQAVRRELTRITAAPAPAVCTQKTLNTSINKGDLDTFGDCMIKLQKFADYTQDELTALNKFITQFFNCTSYSQLTQYGDPAGTHGYVYDPGNGTTFKITALDFTFDIATDSFLNFYVLNPNSAKCLEFAQ